MSVDCIIIRRGYKKNILYYLWNRYNVMQNTIYSWNRYGLISKVVQNYTYSYEYTDWYGNNVYTYHSYKTLLGIKYDENEDRYYWSLSGRIGIADDSETSVGSYIVGKGGGYQNIKAPYWIDEYTVIYVISYPRGGDSSGVKHPEGNVYYPIYSGTSTIYSQGSFIDTITSTNRYQYPDDGRSGSYWYKYSGSNTTYSQGSYIDQVESKDRNTYPDNSYSGSYWYVYQGTSTKAEGKCSALRRIIAESTS